MWLLLCWIIGIASGQWLATHWIIIIAAVAAALGWRARFTLPLAVAGIALIVLGSLYGQPSSDQHHSCPQSTPLEGKVAGTPRLLADRGQYVMEVAPHCRLQITAPRFPAFAEGDWLRLDRAKLKSVAEIDNAGYAAYLRRQDIYATASYPTITRVSSSAQFSATKWIEPVIAKVFLEPDAGVIRALLLANTDGLPVHLQENFRITGLSHLLAISGMNISLLAGILVGLLYLLPLSPLSRTLFLSGLLWGYMAMIGWPISAVRATFFWTIALLALRLHLLVSLPTVLFLTLMAILSLNPLLATDIGFQLSVSAVAGIFLTLFLTKRYLLAAPLVLKVVTSILLVTVGATLATAPIIAYHFGTLSLLSVPANLLVAPAVTIQMVTGIAAVLLGAIFPAAAMLPAYIFHLTVSWMDLISTALARFNGLYIQDLSVSPLFMMTYYTLLLGAAYWWLRYQKRSWRELWQ